MHAHYHAIVHPPMPAIPIIPGKAAIPANAETGAAEIPAVPDTPATEASD